MEYMNPTSESLPPELKKVVATTGTAMVACATIGAIIRPKMGAGIGAGIGAMIGGLGAIVHTVRMNKNVFKGGV